LISDLIILEAHVRDLIARTPFATGRFGFSQLRKWLETPGNYLCDIGVNAVEFQPVTEFDGKNPEEYQWGYMPVHYFAPSSAYAQDPARGSQIFEFQEIVATLHRKNIAVILDVVYNHAGCQSSLPHLDKYVYLSSDEQGNLTNVSGCGNDLQVRSPMVERLVLDSLKHWMQVYDVDGFRFDLAELLGFPLLKRIETELKAINPHVILIAEPWSFRDHIGYTLKPTSFSSWNDGYREFLRRYVRGEGNREGFRYFLKGSVDHLTRLPSQSINYTQSHDDKAWIDGVAEAPITLPCGFSMVDRRRTHLMFATLLMSHGIPTVASGQDFLHSKENVGNTYNRGDLNALDYGRREMFSGLAEYVKKMIKFRLSSEGELLRPKTRLPESFWKFFDPDEPLSSAVAVLYNADGSGGENRLFFAINPHFYTVNWDVSDLNGKDFIPIADTERFNPDGLTPPYLFLKGERMRLPPLSCALWANRSRKEF
jgi:pullulanase/glycogen debranching enzyme